MKKVFAFVLAISMFFCFAGCGSTNEHQENNDSNLIGSSVQEKQPTQTEDNDSDLNQNQSQNDNQTHSEYIETYFVYAEQGAVVTWFDSKTGEFSYKAKCETCGKTESGTHNGLRGGHNTTYSASYSCQNAQCSEWGKSQPVKIGCEVTGEWVEVFD